MLADAYINNKTIDSLDSKAIYKHYIMRTKRMVIEQYGEDMAIRGYRVMAFVTALGGISLDDSVNVIEKDMEYIWNYFAESQSRVELFFNFISESSEKDSISAIKPNLMVN